MGLRCRAATRSAAGLAASIDRRAHRAVVRSVKVYVAGRWNVYRPGRSSNFALSTGEGVVVVVTHKVRWRVPAGDEPLAAPTIHVHRG